MTKTDEAIEIISELLKILDGGFTRSSGTETTGWDECAECGKADWEGHREDCRLAAVIKRAYKAVSGVE